MSFKYYGQFNPPVDKILHELYFPNKSYGISIECGAFNGIDDSCTKFFEESLNWKTINIEPVSHIYNSLQINRPGSININIALSNNNDDKKFKNYKHPTLNFSWGNGSIHHTKEHQEYLETLCGTDNYEIETVKCKTYVDIIKMLNLSHIDLFVLDVEGYEDKVIEGMIGCNILPDIFVIEHGHREPSYFVEKLKSLNSIYTLDKVFFNNSYFVKNKASFK